MPRPINTPILTTCELCRRRKVKCDGRTPKCRNCIRHEAECIYRESYRHGPRRRNHARNQQQQLSSSTAAAAQNTAGATGPGDRNSGGSRMVAATGGQNIQGGGGLTIRTAKTGGDSSAPIISASAKPNSGSAGGGGGGGVGGSAAGAASSNVSTPVATEPASGTAAAQMSVLPLSLSANVVTPHNQGRLGGGSGGDRLAATTSNSVNSMAADNNGGASSGNNRNSAALETPPIQDNNGGSGNNSRGTYPYNQYHHHSHYHHQQQQAAHYQEQVPRKDPPMAMMAVGGPGPGGSSSVVTRTPSSSTSGNNKNSGGSSGYYHHGHSTPSSSGHHGSGASHPYSTSDRQGYRTTGSPAVAAIPQANGDYNMPNYPPPPGQTPYNHHHHPHPHHHHHHQHHSHHQQQQRVSPYEYKSSNIRDYEHQKIPGSVASIPENKLLPPPHQPQPQHSRPHHHHFNRDGSPTPSTATAMFSHNNSIGDRPNTNNNNIEGNNNNSMITGMKRPRSPPNSNNNTTTTAAAAAAAVTGGGGTLDSRYYMPRNTYPNENGHQSQWKSQPGDLSHTQQQQQQQQQHGQQDYYPSSQRPISPRQPPPPYYPQHHHNHHHHHNKNSTSILGQSNSPINNNKPNSPNTMVSPQRQQTLPLPQHQQQQRGLEDSGSSSNNNNNKSSSGGMGLSHLVEASNRVTNTNDDDNNNNGAGDHRLAVIGQDHQGMRSSNGGGGSSSSSTSTSTNNDTMLDSNRNIFTSHENHNRDSSNNIVVTDRTTAATTNTPRHAVTWNSPVPVNSTGEYSSSSGRPQQQSALNPLLPPLPLQQQQHNNNNNVHVYHHPQTTANPQPPPPPPTAMPNTAPGTVVGGEDQIGYSLTSYDKNKLLRFFFTQVQARRWSIVHPGVFWAKYKINKVGDFLMKSILLLASSFGGSIVLPTKVSEILVKRFEKECRQKMLEIESVELEYSNLMMKEGGGGCVESSSSNSSKNNDNNSKDNVAAAAAAGGASSEMDQYIGASSIDTIQAYLLVGVYEGGMGRIQNMWKYTTIALRMVKRLQFRGVNYPWDRARITSRMELLQLLGNIDTNNSSSSNNAAANKRRRTTKLGGYRNNSSITPGLHNEDNIDDGRKNNNNNNNQDQNDIAPAGGSSSSSGLLLPKGGGGQDTAGGGDDIVYDFEHEYLIRTFWYAFFCDTFSACNAFEHTNVLVPSQLPMFPTYDDAYRRTKVTAKLDPTSPKGYILEYQTPRIDKGPPPPPPPSRSGGGPNFCNDAGDTGGGRGGSVPSEDGQWVENDETFADVIGEIGYTAYLVTQFRLLSIINNIAVRCNFDGHIPPIEEFLNIERELIQSHRNIPKRLRLDIDQIETDDLSNKEISTLYELIMLEFTIHFARTSLYRVSLVASMGRDPRSYYSIKFPMGYIDESKISSVFMEDHTRKSSKPVTSPVTSATSSAASPYSRIRGNRNEPAAAKPGGGGGDILQVDDGGCGGFQNHHPVDDHNIPTGTTTPSSHRSKKKHGQKTARYEGYTQELLQKSRRECIKSADRVVEILELARTLELEQQGMHLWQMQLMTTVSMVIIDQMHSSDDNEAWSAMLKLMEILRGIRWAAWRKPVHVMLFTVLYALLDPRLRLRDPNSLSNSGNSVVTTTTDGGGCGLGRSLTTDNNSNNMNVDDGNNDDDDGVASQRSADDMYPNDTMSGASKRWKYHQVPEDLVRPSVLSPVVLDSKNPFPPNHVLSIIMGSLGMTPEQFFTPIFPLLKEYDITKSLGGEWYMLEELVRDYWANKNGGGGGGGGGSAGSNLPSGKQRRGQRPGKGKARGGVGSKDPNNGGFMDGNTKDGNDGGSSMAGSGNEDEANEQQRNMPASYSSKIFNQFPAHWSQGRHHDSLGNQAIF